jgi:hypothetical protein
VAFTTTYQVGIYSLTGRNFGFQYGLAILRHGKRYCDGKKEAQGSSIA